MRIELFGCTNAGKSTLIRAMLQAGTKNGVDVALGDDFVLRKSHLNWITGYLPRRLLVEPFALIACLASWRANARLYRLLGSTLSRLPPSVGWFERTNIARNVLRAIGVYEFVGHYVSPTEVVLLDEGTLQTIHYLFVHVAQEPRAVDLETFHDSVPVPEVAIFVRQDEGVLIKRTLARGHKRLPSASPTQAEIFIQRAIAVFESLVRTPTVANKLLILEPERNIVVRQDQTGSSELSTASRILRAGLDMLSDAHRQESASDSYYQEATNASHLLP